LFGSKFGTSNDHLANLAEIFESLREFAVTLWPHGPHAYNMLSPEGWDFYLLNGMVLVGRLDDWILFAANHEEAVRFLAHHNVKLVDRREHESDS
jgi:hypothetical protein